VSAAGDSVVDLKKAFARPMTDPGDLFAGCGSRRPLIRASFLGTPLVIEVRPGYRAAVRRLAPMVYRVERFAVCVAQHTSLGSMKVCFLLRHSPQQHHRPHRGADRGRVSITGWTFSSDRARFCSTNKAIRAETGTGGPGFSLEAEFFGSAAP